MTWQIITANESYCVNRPFEVVPRAAELLIANGWMEQPTLWTIGEMAGLPDGTVFRTAAGGVFEIRDGHMLRTDSKTWWSPIADWLPVTVLYSPQQQPPETQDPKGSSFLPKGGHVKLTRNQADLALRHYTAEYAEQAHKDPESDTQEATATLTREISWRIDADIKHNAIEWLLVAWHDVLTGMSTGEQCVNMCVNDILDAANFPGPHILRYSEQVAA